MNRRIQGVLRAIKHIIYMHADHFEMAGGYRVEANKDPDILEQKLVVLIEDFKKTKIKPSLFVHPWFGVRYQKEKVVITPSAASMVLKKYLKQLEDTGADINLHIHHERWTNTDLVIEPWKTLLRENKVNDAQMLRTYIETSKEFFKEAGIDMESWGFVHGMWALNASDKRACNISNELIILNEHGCFGDFTFPAGRERCSPKMSGIFFVPPKKGRKVYNIGLPLIPRRNQLVNPKMFIVFYPTTRNVFTAIDSLLLHKGERAYYYNTTLSPNTFAGKNTVGALCPEDPREIVQEWLLSSMVIDRTLIIKTNAHSMNDDFWLIDGKVENKSPLFHPDHVERMGILERFANKFEVEIHYLTARELYAFTKAIDKGKPSDRFFKEIKK